MSGDASFEATGAHTPSDGLASAGQSLGAINPGVLHALSAEVGEVSHVRLREPATEVLDSVAEPGATASAATTARYRLLGEIARGGMGAVLRGHDADLGRDVAIKVLLETHRGRTELWQRFIEEAQIAGQLQHPGIVPVYELGMMPDRRPFFTMKLVKGRTLAALLAEGTTGLPRLVGIFEQVCQTVAYAHARGVIHRDLKPLNIMVGSFGEVQVMDWGLAKVLDEENRGDEDASVIRIRDGEIGLHTQAGSILGTPAYMAPEQARGEVERVDQRADVFGLGAILCEILTGRPPFSGRSAEAIRRAAAADLAAALARVDACAADRELIDLARGCLAADPEGRPRDAGMVAQAVTSYRESVERRLRDAELASAEARTRAQEERKRRRVSLALAAAMLALALTGGGAAWWWNYQREALARAVEAEVHEAETLRQEARSAPADDLSRWTEALTALERARGRLGESRAHPALRQRVEELLEEMEREQADRRMLARLAQVRKLRQQVRNNHYDDSESDRAFAAAFRDHGVDLDRVSVEEAVRRLEESPIRRQLVAAIDHWIMIRRLLTRQEQPATWNHLVEVARRLDPDPWRNRLRIALVSRDTRPVTDLARDVDLAKQPPDTLYHLGILLMTVEIDVATGFLERAVQHYPDDFGLRTSLAALLSDLTFPPRTEEALRHYSAALAIDPNNAGTLHNISNALYALKRWDEALDASERALRINPRYAQAHHTRGYILSNRPNPDYDAALAAYEQARQHGRDIAHTLTNIGYVWTKKGDLVRAEQSYREAVRLQPERSLAHLNLGFCLRQQNKLDEAIASFQAAIRHLDTPVKKTDDFWQVVEVKKRPFLRNGEAATAYTALGITYRLKGRMEEALTALRQALEHEPTHTSAHVNLAVILLGHKKPDEALAACRHALTASPDDVDALYYAGRALQMKNDSRAALTFFRRAVDLNDSDAEYLNGLAVCLRSLGQIEEAIRAFRRAVRLAPGTLVYHINLAETLQAACRHSEALAILRGRLAALPASDLTRASLEGRIRIAERQRALDSRLDAVVSGQRQPTTAEEWVAFAQYARHGRKNALAAVRIWEQALEARPELAADPAGGQRYLAACAAATASAGAKPEDQVRLRKRALDWLTADLKILARRVTEEPAEHGALVQRILKHWQGDAELSRLRDEVYLRLLPVGERLACRRLWTEVDTLLARMEKP